MYSGTVSRFFFRCSNLRVARVSANPVICLMYEQQYDYRESTQCNDCEEYKHKLEKAAKDYENVQERY